LFLLANIAPLFDISLNGDTRNALTLNGAIALSEYGDVVTLLIAERFLEISDHWRSDDSLIATGANLFVSGRDNGMRLRHSNSQGSCSAGRSALPDPPARLNCVSSTTIQELARLCRPSTALHGGGGGRQQQATLRSRH
jgi:hypothetical protein